VTLVLISDKVYCVQCNELLKPEVNFLSLERGGMLCPKHGANRPETIALSLAAQKVLRFLQTRPWEQVAPLRITAVTMRLVENVLARYIVYHLERTVRSAAFLERLQQGLAQAEKANADGQEANGK
jgi:hypothetical protein